ncbi:MAG: glycosyl transferase family 36 [Bacteroidetes bacterium]|nr:glycosyl transferase family 36 [Bacteroidota bacterium]MBU1116438.1 glycosyl transferase family 36 [Bacteroidota bacterium]MBU1800017.1 glycosyl transferase family 36 [Bacteroidota bacterium]
MNYGSFSEDGKEFIINNPKTPTPWINYIYNGNYFATISNNGGGISYFKNPLHGRITRYRINDVPPDRPGKFIYVKDNETKNIWSLTWQPVGKNPEAYKAVHGFGYTYVDSLIDEIDSRVLYFVPQNDNREIWKATVTNNSNKKRNLSLFGYVEFALGHGLIDIINQCDDQHFNRVSFDKELNTLFATKTYWVTNTSGTQQQENKEWDQWAYFTCNEKIVKYETLRERFIGLFRNENNPEAIETGKLTCEDTDFGNTVGAIQIDVDLEPGETKTIIFSLGVIPKVEFEEKKSSVPSLFNDTKVVDESLNEVKLKWNNFFKNARVETPDSEVNTFMNYWIQYQAKVAFDVGRVASFYYWGISRGFGFRDTSQDVLAVTISNPELAKSRISFLAKQIFIDGRVYHHFYNEGKGELTKHCDDPLWFILAVTEYIKETGNIDFLDETSPFADGGEGSILEHLFSVVNFVKNNLAKHNLPIFGRGDWNDTLDYIGGEDGGESVWGAMFYVAMLNKFIELLENINIDNSEIIKLRDLIKNSVEEFCWDGEWYLRAFGAKDKKIGSKENKYGKIFINTQSWPIIAEFSNSERLLSSLNSVKTHLDTEYGPKICAPAFREIDPNIGLITRCVPGKKENGAVFCHPTTWLIQAECLMGRGNAAFDYFKKLLPNKVDSDIFSAEPYVYSQYITSNEHSSNGGKASHSWQTGTAAWMYRISFDYILGVRPTYNGLLINPAIPSSWNSFIVERNFRGKKYIINVENPYNVESGIYSIFVDGNEIEGNILPISNKPICNVLVILGKKSQAIKKSNYSHIEAK